MKVSEITGRQWKTIAISLSLIMAWITLPQYFQAHHDISAVQISFAITVIYYLGFKLWKKIGSR